MRQLFDTRERPLYGQARPSSSGRSPTTSWRTTSRSASSSLLSAAVIDRYGVGKSTLANTRNRLAETGILLHRANDRLTFVDPLLATWIHEQRVGT